MNSHAHYPCRAVLIAFAVMSAINACALGDPPVSKQAVDDCVSKAIGYLYSLQKDGTWDIIWGGSDKGPQLDNR